MNSKKRILIAPLNWGLGHATRCIPIIDQLTELGQEVIIGANGAAALLLKKEYPNFEHVDIPGYDFRYGKGGNIFLPVLLQVPAFIMSIKKEHEKLDQLISEKDIDLVISDNRYGLWSSKIPSVLITHQLFIKVPGSISFSEPVIKKLIFDRINKFTYCIIPDLPDVRYNLSGDLAHKHTLLSNCRFIGLLSRFSGHIKKGTGDDILAIVSGPEPQRSIFQEKLEEQLARINRRSIIVTGNAVEVKRRKGNTEIMPLMKSSDLYRLLVRGPQIISRCGYSSLMDYISLGIDPIVVPTPGQTEQEYLAKRLKNNRWCYSMDQNDLNIEKGLQEGKNYSFPNELKKNDSLLTTVLSEILNA